MMEGIQRTKSQRSSYLDLVKGLGIILVVLGHSLQYGMGTGYTNFWNLPLYKFIYSFHMPLFMTISGYLFWFSYSKRGGMYVIRNRVKSLLFPIFVYGIIASVPTLWKNPTEFSLHEAFFKEHLWFFWSILIATCIANLMFRLSKSYQFNEWLFIVCLFFGMMLFGDDWIIAHHKFVLPYFLVGGVICKCRFAIIYKKHLWLVIPIYFLSMLFYKSDTYIYVSQYSITHGDAIKHLGIDVYRFLVGALGTITILLLARYAHGYISRCIIGDIFVWLGKNTLFIYFIQSLLFALVPRINVPYMGWWQPLAMFVIILFVSVIFVLAVRNNRLVSCVFFGKKY